MSETKKTVSVILDFDKWLKLRIWCAKRNKTISSLLAKYIDSVLEGGDDNE